MFKIGDKAKGFKFDGDAYPFVGYDEEMDDVIGVVGEVSYIGDSSYSVHFEGVEVDWAYPTDLWYLGKVEETQPFKIGDRVKFKKSSIDTGMIDATEDDVFQVVSVHEEHWGTLVKLEGVISTVNITHLEHVKEEVMNNTEEQEIKWEVGQEVFCLLRGKGVVHQIYNTGVYWSGGVDVYFRDHGVIRFKFDGTIGAGFNRSLFFSEPKIEAEKFPPKKPFVPKLKKGDTIIYRERGSSCSYVGIVDYEDHDSVTLEDADASMYKHAFEFYKLGEEIIFN